MIHLAITLLLTAATLCCYFYIREHNAAQAEISEFAEVVSEYTTLMPVAQEPLLDPDTPLGEASIPFETAELPYVAVDFVALSGINSDTVGWIAIPDSPISYPVVQAEDNNKYLDMSFKRKRSSAGTPFADSNNNMQSLDANTIIYGHNMGGGRTDMFGELLKYKERDYYDSHRYIQFDTISEQHGWWKVFAVIEYDIRSKDFNYLYLWFDNDAAFTDWVAGAAECSLYEPDIEVTPQDRVLTLSTCDRSKYGRSGRLLVMAVKMDQ